MISSFGLVSKKLSSRSPTYSGSATLFLASIPISILTGTSPGGLSSTSSTSSICGMTVYGHMVLLRFSPEGLGGRTLLRTEPLTEPRISRDCLVWRENLGRELCSVMKELNLLGLTFEMWSSQLSIGADFSLKERVSLMGR